MLVSSVPYRGKRLSNNRASDEVETKASGGVIYTALRTQFPQTGRRAMPGSSRSGPSVSERSSRATFRAGMLGSASAGFDARGHRAPSRSCISPYLLESRDVPGSPAYGRRPIPSRSRPWGPGAAMSRHRGEYRYGLTPAVVVFFIGSYTGRSSARTRIPAALLIAGYAIFPRGQSARVELAFRVTGW